MEKSYKSPKLSIIVATYNAGKTLSKSLESIINQSFGDWECVIVDGLSKDDTISVVHKYVESDSRIRYISEPDNGIYDAFNKGWRMSIGEWIYYLGADDILIKSGFEDIFSRIGENTDIAYANVIYRSPMGLNHVKSSEKVKCIGWNLPCAHQGFVMKRTSIERNGGFDAGRYQICADYDLILRAYLNSSKIEYIDTDLAVFDTSGASGVVRIYKECFQIRRKNRSVSLIGNCLIYLQGVMIFGMRRVKYWLIAIYKRI